MAEKGEQLSDHNLPKARVAKRWRVSWIWVVPVLAAGFVGWLIVRNYLARGPKVTVTFSDAKELEPGKSEVKFRGAKVGLVSGIKVSKDLQAVRVTMEFDKPASDLARIGSQFWIVEPQVTAERIRGLHAIVSGNYVEVKPGAGERTNQFIGLDEAPVLAHQRKGLEIVLLRAQLGSVENGTAIYFRGTQVGAVTHFALSPDAVTVRINAHIDEGYEPLIRENTKFWNAGGINFNLGLLGANLRAQSFKALIAGGIAFNNPPQPGARVKNGAVFRLYDKAEDDWEKWVTEIKISPPVSPEPSSEESKPPARGIFRK